MNERWLITYLSQVNHLSEDSFEGYPLDKQVRALMNITMPEDLSEEYYKKQDEFLQDLLSHKKVTDVNDFSEQISLYQGDITLLKADAITNAANNQMLGCFIPLHGCIDNAINSFAGLQVRRDMMEIMKKQGHPEENGQVKVTKGYNLPATYIFHTVGPALQGWVSPEDKVDLMNCYLSCLRKADEMKLKSIVFCSISTGVFGYPIEQASSLAIDTVKKYINNTGTTLKVVFDVFSDKDRNIYERNLQTD